MSFLSIDRATTDQRLGITDAFARPLKNLRISVTDRCNLRCQYCMPEEEYVWLSRSDILQFEEISALVDIFADLGADKVGEDADGRAILLELEDAAAGEPDILLLRHAVLAAQ